MTLGWKEEHGFLCFTNSWRDGRLPTGKGERAPCKCFPHRSPQTVCKHSLCIAQHARKAFLNGCMYFAVAGYGEKRAGLMHHSLCKGRTPSGLSLDQHPQFGPGQKLRTQNKVPFYSWEFCFFLAIATPCDLPNPLTWWLLCCFMYLPFPHLPLFTPSFAIPAMTITSLRRGDGANHPPVPLFLASLSFLTLLPGDWNVGQCSFLRGTWCQALWKVRFQLPQMQGEDREWSERESHCYSWKVAYKHN